TPWSEDSMSSFLAMVCMVILSPPDEEPVIPEITAVETVETTKALSLMSSIFSCTTANTASDAITAPNPTSEAVVKQGKMAFLATSENSRTDCRSRLGNISTMTTIAKANESVGPQTPVRA